MDDKYLIKTKLYFTITIFLLITTMFGGSFLARDNTFFTKKNILWISDYFEYRINFASASAYENLSKNSFFLQKKKTIYKVNEDQIANSIPVLLYHKIIDQEDGYSISLDNFEKQMFTLKMNGWQTISIDDFYKFSKGEIDLPNKSFLLTFDDGAKDSYYPVDALLKAFDYNAVMFIITKHSLGSESGNDYYLSEEELEKMIQTGRWEIQSHGKNDHDLYQIDANGNTGHFISNKLWIEKEQRLETEAEFKERIYNDLLISKQEIENNLNVDVISFAYPFGDFGQGSVNFPKAEEIILSLIKEIYPLCFYQFWNDDNNYNYSTKDLFMAKRINVKPEWETKDLIEFLNNSKAKNNVQYREPILTQAN